MILGRKVRRKMRNWLAGALGPWLLRAWVATLRVRVLGLRVEHGGVVRGNESGIYVLWHQRLLTPAAYFHGQRLRPIISEHADGELIARIAAGLGHVPVRGSSTRGGSKALLEILRRHESSGPHAEDETTPAAAGREEAQLIIVTTDGPRGPLHCFQPGAVYLASRTGLPIRLIAVALEKHWSLRSWDRFQLPKPFSRALIRCSEESFRVGPDLDREGIEAERRRLEASLRAFTEESDASFATLYARAVPCRRGGRPSRAPAPQPDAARAARS